MLHEFLAVNRDEIIARCLNKVALKRTPRPIEADLELGVPMFLDQLIDSLRLDRLAGSDLKRSAFLNGADLLRHGVTIAQVVHSYGDVCQAVTELAVEKQESITPEEFHVFNQCIDEAIAESVSQYQSSRDEMKRQKASIARPCTSAALRMSCATSSMRGLSRTLRSEQVTWALRAAQVRCSVAA